MKTTNIYGEVPENVHNAVVSALNEVNSRHEDVRRKIKFSTSVLIAAVIGLAATITVAAVGLYFDKTGTLENGKLTYEFNIDYELKPGEFEVTPDYLPEGYKEQQSDSNKYSTDEDYGRGISVFVYNTSSLDIGNEKSSYHKVENVEETVLSGMEADIITLAEAEKYEFATHILLFNPTEGYVIWVSGNYNVSHDELIKFADNLTVTKIGEGEFETPEDKEQRKTEEELQAESDLKEYQGYLERVKNGIPDEMFVPIGDELVLGEVGYTVNEYEFFEKGNNLDKNGFSKAWSNIIFEYMNDDGTLKPYTRQHFDDTGYELLEEETVDQIFLRVNVTAKCYKQPIDTIPLDANLEFATVAENGNLTWDTDTYHSVRADCPWTFGEQCIWINNPNQNDTTDGKQQFWAEINEGESITYDLVFIVDKDRADKVILDMKGANDVYNGRLYGYWKLDR